MSRKAGFVSLLGGMNSGVRSPLIGANQYVKGLNISSRGGLVHTRPVFKKITINEPNFTTGKFQGAALYSLNSADRLVFVVAGRVFGYNLSDGSLTDYSAVGGVGTLDATVDSCYFVKAEKFFIVQDGVNQPIIINDNDDPDHARRANAVDEIPVGTKMAYGHGRLFVVIRKIGADDVGQRFFVAGDIAKPNDLSNLLKFTEVQYLDGGGAFSLPNELGFIEGMAFMRNAQSGEGLGSLIIFAKNGASAFAVNAPRTEWQEIDISQVLFTNAGTKSPFGIVSVNNDLYFRSLDGLRSLGYSISAISGGGAIGNNPISNEINSIFDLDTDADMPFTSAVNVNNRLLITSIGETDARGHYFKSLVSMDFSPFASLSGSTRPVYDGIWTGLDFMHIANGLMNNKNTAFVFAKSPDDENELYYLDETVGEYTDGTNSRTLCRLYTGAMRFTKEINLDLGEFMNAELWFNDLLGTVTIVVYYRPFGYPLWNPCNSVTFTAAPGSLPQYRKKIKLQPTAKPCDPVNKKHINMASEFEFCIEITGHAEIAKAIFELDNEQKEAVLGCNVSADTVDLQAGDAGVELDDLSYQIT